MKNIIYFIMLFGLFGCEKNNKPINTERSLLIETIRTNSGCEIYEIINSDSDAPANWSIKPTELKLIPNNEKHYLIKAQIIDEYKNVESGFMDLITPERISNYVISNLDKPRFNTISELKDKDVIPAVASDCFGLYELYYSEFSPNTGLNTLKKGLKLSKQKSIIAEDIAYILRDEKRLDEALKYFIISTEHKPSSEYIFGEMRIFIVQKEMKQKLINTRRNSKNIKSR